ncbi:MAG: SoxR reducing system RseC family protein [Alcanivoracaceae bacterium]|nr:SoxR reducing system RseC family protein [Alcanivoracaceae bacterium]
MIEEQGRVVAVESGAVWVETVRHTSCQSCAASKGCGHALLDGQRAGARATVRALSTDAFRVDDLVVVGIPEGLLMRGAVLVYLVPLLLLFAGALVGEQFTGSFVDPAAVGGLLGLAGGFLINRWYSVRHRRDPAMHPQVLRRQAGSPLSCVQLRDPI